MLIVLLLALAGCQQKDNAELGASLGPPVVYLSDDGTRLEVRFGALADQSLHFVKLRRGTKAEETLPQLVSASGARFSDERALEFWIKGSSASLTELTETGDWITTLFHVQPLPRRQNGP